MSRRILIVDDEADFRVMLKAALESADCAVEVATNGNEAIRLQRRSPADIVVTDIFMPGRDGIETIDAFRREFPQTKIVAMSGGSQLAKLGNQLSSAALIGIAATLQKPFKVQALLRTSCVEARPSEIAAPQPGIVTIPALCGMLSFDCNATSDAHASNPRARR